MSGQTFWLIYSIVGLVILPFAARWMAREVEHDEVKGEDLFWGLLCAAFWGIVTAGFGLALVYIGIKSLVNIKPLTKPDPVVLPTSEEIRESETRRLEADAAAAEREMKEARS